MTLELRPKRGRPPAGTVSVSTRVKTEQYDELAKRSTRGQVSVARLVRRAIERELEPKS